MKTADVEFNALFERLVEKRSVTVLIPAERLAVLTVRLHRRRKADRDLFSSLGEQDVWFGSDAICCQVDDKYGTDKDGNIRVTYVIAPKPRQLFTMIEDEGAEAQDGKS